MKRFSVIHTVERHDERMELQYDEKVIGDFDDYDEAVKKIEEVGGIKVLPNDDDWYDPLAHPVGYYWISEN